MRVKKKPKISLAKYKKSIWKFVSIAVRLRDADNQGICTCISCGKKGYYIRDVMQAGHFFTSKHHPNVRWNLMNIHAQCSACNGSLSGNVYRYALNLAKRYSKKLVKEIDELADLPYKENIIDLDLVKQQCILLIKTHAKNKNLYDWKDMFLKYEIKQILDEREEEDI